MSQSESSDQEMLSQQDRRSFSQSREIKNKQKFKRKGRPPSGPKENGLTRLTRKFVKMIKSSKGLTLDIAKASEELKIHKRRIYDITNVLEVIGYIQKIRKNQIKWIGEINQHDFDREIQGMKEKISNIEYEEQTYRRRIQDMKQAISETLQKHKENLFLTSKDIEKINTELTKDDPQMQVIFVHAPIGSQLTVWKNEDGKTNAVINSQPTNLSCSICISNHNTIKHYKAEKKKNQKKLKKQLKQKAKKQGHINPPSKIKSIEKKDENKPKTVSKPKISQASLPKAIPKEKKEIRSRQKSEKKVRQRQVRIKRQRKIRTKENLEEKSIQKESLKKNQPQKKKQQTEKMQNQQLKREYSKQNEEKRNVAQETVNLKTNVVIEKKKREKKVSESKQKKVEKVKKIVKEKKIEKEKKKRVKKQQGQRSLSKRGRTKKQKHSQNQKFDIFEEEDN